MNNIDELLSRWDEARIFKEIPYKHIMPETLVTLDEPIQNEFKIDKLINGVRHRINRVIKNIRKNIKKER